MPHNTWSSTDNIEQLDFNPLTTNGNAEVQVATTPDGETYAYLLDGTTCILLT